MHILMAAAELTPLLRNGDLGDAVASLSAALCGQGHEVSVVVPCFRAIREGKMRLKKSGMKFSVDVGPGRIPCEVFELKTSGGPRVFAVARDEYFDRSGIYGVDGRDYQDNAARFIFFSKCVVELARRMDPVPDILHAHSWETALAPVLCHEQRLPIRTVLSPHSLAYQGNFWSYDFALTNLPDQYFSARGLEYFGSMNCLKGGLVFADAVVLPGERFASEAQTPAGGCGLDPILREHQHKLFGLVSFSGLESWSPASDAALVSRYDAMHSDKKALNRAPLLQACELASDPAGAVGVAFAQGSAGLDILLTSLDRLLATDARVILLGDTDPALTKPLEVARRKHAGRFAYRAGSDERLARQALAGADLMLVPGAVEPDTLWLRRGIRYGTIPVALQCGGLFQLVREWEPSRNAGNGFPFASATTDGLVDKIRHAQDTLRDPARRAALLAANLGVDFSCEANARAHAALYSRLLAGSSAVRAA